MLIKDKSDPKYGWHSWFRPELEIKHIVKLWGGLGNQMFQYAFGQALSQQCNVPVAYDFSWFEGIGSQFGHSICPTERKYGLSFFKVPLRIAAKSQVVNCCSQYTKS